MLSMNTKNLRRTIPSDALQAKGLIALCVEFNWTSIAIVYNKGAYGAGLSLSLQELATSNNIEASAIAVSNEDQSTYLSAAELIKESGIYIIEFDCMDIEFFTICFIH